MLAAAATRAVSVAPRGSRTEFGRRTSGTARAPASPLHDATSSQPLPAGRRRKNEKRLHRQVHMQRRTSSIAAKTPNVGGLPCWGSSLGSALVSASAASVQKASMQRMCKRSAVEALYPAKNAPASSSGVPARIRTVRGPRQYASQAALSRNGGVDACGTLASACACSTSRRNDCAQCQQHSARQHAAKRKQTRLELGQRTARSDANSG